MEKIQGQNKLCSLNQKVIVRRSLEVQGSGEDQRFELEEEDQLLQMMQQSEDLSAAVLPFKDPNFLALLSLQTLEKPPWGLGNYLPHEVPELSHSPNYYYQNPSLERINEAMISTQEEIQLNPQRKRRNNNLVASSVSREKRKRKRTKPAKNTEEMESQRMTHITVERNRRRQMNVYLNSLRSLIPSSYILRGDQASIVGGAIDFVKILEQQLQSLEAQKITQQTDTKDVSLRASDEEQSSTKLRIDATVIESHVNLKIQCPKKQGQLLRSIIWLEKLRLTVLHLNVTSPCNASVSYSFNLKMEDECVLGSADEITAAVRQIFDC